MTTPPQKPAPRPAPADDAAAFMAETQAAMTDILRARVQSGINRGDPLDPLVQALARGIAVMGRLPGVLARRQKAAEDQAVMGLQVALQHALADLVSRAGGQMAAADRAKWLSVAAILLALAFGSEWWWAYGAGRDAALQSETWRAEAAIEAAKAGIPKTAAWAASILAEDQRDRARWAARLSPSEFEAAQWGVSKTGQLARRFDSDNVSNGGLFGLLSCAGDNAQRGQDKGRTACYKTTPFWVVQ